MQPQDEQPPSIVKVSIHRRRQTGFGRAEDDFLAKEEPLEIRIRGESVAVVMRTPGQDQELAAGFLFSEAIIKDRSQIIKIAPCRAASLEDSRNILNVFLASNVELNIAQLRRTIYASSSCGICGKASIETVHQHFPPIESRDSIRTDTLLELPTRMSKAQKDFARTGGLHAAAIFDRRGNLMVLREDIGRHNAVDKTLGFGMLQGLLPFSNTALLVSGRASFEIVQKALAARIPIIAAVSAPSSLAVEFAQESGQTLVGFLRGTQFNVYSHPERLENSTGHSALL